MKKIITVCYVFFVVVIHVQAQTSDSLNFGWLKLELNIEQFYLVLDDRYSEAILMKSGDSLSVSTGETTITIIGKNINDYRRPIQIRKGETYSLRISIAIKRHPATSYYLIENGMNAVISTDDDSDIFINGKYAGSGYLETLLDPGNFKIEITHPEAGNLKKDIQIIPKKLNEVNLYNMPQHNTNLMLNLIPGMGYMLTDQLDYAVTTYGIFAIIGVFALNQNRFYDSKLNDFNHFSTLYQEATTRSEAISARNSSERAINKMNAANRNLRISVAGAAAIYIFTTWHGMRKPRSGYPGKTKLRPAIRIKQDPNSGQFYSAISIRGGF